MKHIDSVKKAIIFTDIKNFTLKNSLLTQLQVRKLLETQDEIVLPIIEKNLGEVVKVMGDAYMIAFDNIENAIKSAIEIQKKLKEYNSKIKFNLNKIELRITVNFGVLQKEQTLVGEDYFGDSVNIASRLQQDVSELQNPSSENKIFTTDSVIKELENSNSFIYKYLGKTNLRGVLYDIEVYEIIFNEEEIESMKNDKIDRKKHDDYIPTNKIKNIKSSINHLIIEFSLAAGILGAFSIPLIGGYFSLPLHLALLKVITKKYSIEIGKVELKPIIFTMFYSLLTTFLLTEFIYFIKEKDISGDYLFMISSVGNLIFTIIIGKIVEKYFYNNYKKVNKDNKELKKMLA